MNGQPVIKPPQPTGLGDLAVLLSVLNDKDQLAKHLKKVQEAHDKANAAIAVVGKVGEITALHDKAAQKAAEAEQVLADAKAEADAIIADAEAQVAPMHTAAEQAKREADAILTEAKADAKRRNERCAVREKDVAAREDAMDQREAYDEARNADIDRRTAAVAKREEQVQATIARLAAAGIQVQ